MRYPRVLVWEHDGKLARLLENSSQTGGFFIANRPKEEGTAGGGTFNWSLRQPRNLVSCLKLLRGGGPSLLIVRVATRLGAAATPEEHETEQRRRERAFQVLDRVSWLRPEALTIAVSDAADDTLAGLAWELGATCVLFPPQPLPLLPVLAGHLMRQAAGGPAS
jgi:hypothetical protein